MNTLQASSCSVNRFQSAVPFLGGQMFLPVSRIEGRLSSAFVSFVLLQIVLYREEEVLECECDMAMVHHLLSQIPQDLPYELLISRAGDLFVQFPPSELAREAAVHER